MIKYLFGISLTFVVCSLSQAQAEDCRQVLVGARRACENLRANVRFEKKDALWRATSADLFVSERPGVDFDQLRDLVSLESLKVLENYGGGRTTAGCIEKLTLMAKLRALRFQNFVTGDAVGAICHNLRGLEELGLDNCQEVGDDDLTSIGELANLKRLDMRRTLHDRPITNGVLAHIKSLKTLQELNIGIIEVTDDGIAELRGLDSLRHLDVSQSSVTLGGVASLHLPHLEDLSVRDYCSDSQLAASLTNVRSLNISMSKKRQAVRLPENLRRLTVVQAEYAPDFQPMPQHLEYVSVYNPIFGKDVDLNWLAPLPALTELRLLTSGDKAMMAAAQCKTLRSLEIAECTSPSERGIDHIAEMPKLGSLSIVDGVRVTDKALGSIGRLTGLRSLKLGSLDGVTIDGMAALANVSELKALSIGMARGGAIVPFDKVLERMASLTMLEELSLDNVKITDDGMKYLSALKRLRRLDLTDSTGFTDDGLADLIAALPDLETIAISYSPSR